MFLSLKIVVLFLKISLSLLLSRPFGRIRFLGYRMEFKASVFRLVLRVTWVRLRPVLALTGIYFAFLVPSINYVIAFSKLNLCNY